jgi:hypothetical protein
MFGARPVMAQVQGGQFELGDMLRPQEREAMELLADLGILREVGDSFRRPSDGAAKHCAGRGEADEIPLVGEVMRL